MRKVNYVLYGITGALFILIGAAGLLWPSLEQSLNWRGQHILREQGAAMIFVGLMAFWCVFNYERRRAVHLFLIVLALLLSLIHWLDYFQGHLLIQSPLVNTVPLILFTLMLFIGRFGRAIGEPGMD
jgi:hypothetical protein